MGRLWTIGHGTHPIESFVAALAAPGIERLVDVRRFPGSRRNPQYGRDALAEALAGAGIVYEHSEALGGRRSRPAGDERFAVFTNAQFQGYAMHMTTPEWRVAFAQLRRRGTSEAVAILCSETPFFRCHRRFVADALTAAGVEVVHLVARGRPEAHRVLPPGEVAGGVLRYGGEVAYAEG
jgi:uncharacterized protein (DUF488 family)